MVRRYTVAGLVASLALLGPQAGPAQAATSLTLFTSKIYPYSILYPTGWVHQSGPYGQYQIDYFLRPKTVKRFHDNVNIFRTPRPHGVTDDDTLFQANRAQISGIAHSNAHTIGTVTVAGHHLKLLGWMQSGAASGPLIETQAFLFVAGKAYYFTLTTAKGDEGTWRPVFSAMLRSFHLR